MTGCYGVMLMRASSLEFTTTQKAVLHAYSVEAAIGLPYN